MYTVCMMYVCMCAWHTSREQQNPIWKQHIVSYCMGLSPSPMAATACHFVWRLQLRVPNSTHCLWDVLGMGMVMVMVGSPFLVNRNKPSPRNYQRCLTWVARARHCHLRPQPSLRWGDVFGFNLCISSTEWLGALDDSSVTNNVFKE